jgi:uncharacterized protein YjbJ (UPF0337 family)
MNINRISAAGLLAAACIGGLGGCGQSDSDTARTGIGPAQQAGKALDDAGAKATAKVQEEVGKADAAARQARDAVPDAVEHARSNLNQVTDKVGQKVEQAGQKIQQAAH